MKLLLSCVAGLSLLLFSQFDLHSQSFSRVRPGGGAFAADYANDMAPDADGNVYVVGIPDAMKQ